MARETSEHSKSVNREGHSNGSRRKRDRYISRRSSLVERGFACVGLDRPTDPVNIGHALRASFCYGARMVILGGDGVPGALGNIVTDPERACYVFGPENGSLSPEIAVRSRHKVMIPTNTALNLGMTVNTVLYDRLSKSWGKVKARWGHLLGEVGSGEVVAGRSCSGDLRV